MRAATRSRALLLDQIGRARDGDAEALARAARIASQCAEALDETRRRADVLAGRREVEGCARALAAWLEPHVEACDAVQLAAGTRDRRHLERASQVLDSATAQARAFNLARRALVRRLAAG